MPPVSIVRKMSSMSKRPYVGCKAYIRPPGGCENKAASHAAHCVSCKQENSMSFNVCYCRFANGVCLLKYGQPSSSCRKNNWTHIQVSAWLPPLSKWLTLDNFPRAMKAILTGKHLCHDFFNMFILLVCLTSLSLSLHSLPRWGHKNR